MLVQEIARRAGVSITTVSRVLNNNPNVRPETASQVRKVLEQHPYDRNAIRRGPRSGKRVKRRTVAGLRHASIAIVVIGRSHERWFKEPLFASIISSINRAAAEKDISLRLHEVLDLDQISDSLHTDAVDGALLFIASEAKPGLLEAMIKRLPVLRVMGDDMICADIDQVRTDNLAIGRMAHEYLAGQGCKNMACVSTRSDHGALFLRLLGFSTSINHKLKVQPTVFTTGPLPYGQCFGAGLVQCSTLDEVAAKIAASWPRIDGLFVTQDVETIGLYPLLAHHGVRPGQDLKMISCNNDESLAMLSPRPATIDLGADAIGRWALRRLINRLSRPDEPPIQMLVKPSLVVRQGHS